MTYPDCPICKTNINVFRLPDLSTHTAGMNGSKSYSDTFRCECCGGIISYREETKYDKLVRMTIDYQCKPEPVNVTVINDLNLDEKYETLYSSLGIPASLLTKGEEHNV